MKLIFILNLLFFLFTAIAYGHEADEPTKKEPPKIGNFILPGSQRPGPLIGFGENIIDKNQTQFFLFLDDIVAVNKYNIDVVPALLYGICDDFSIYFVMPMAASFKDKKKHSSGWEDAYLQFEYAFYVNETDQLSDQATIITNLSFPTGSSTKKPPTGFGSPSFFGGTTFNRTYIKWFFFGAYGMLLTTSNDHTKFGNEFLYQGGIGRNLFDIGTRWIFAWMIEADGQYTQKNKIQGIIDNNSGGNVVWITPSLWISSKKLILQLGVGLPVTQHLNGNQGLNKYLLAFDMGWTF